MNNNLGEYLVQLRKQKGITQEELATQCNVTRQQISRIETGLSKPSIELAKQLGYVLEIDWSIFFSL